MNEERIRLRYTGFIAFIAQGFTVITGVLFTLTITRRLTPEEFGLWQYIGVFLAYFLLPFRPISYWATRFAARGEDIFITVVAMAILMALPASILFVFYSSFMAALASSPLIYFLLCSIQIPALYLELALSSFAYGKRPHISQYAIIIYEAFKVALALWLVVFMNLRLIGAIMAVTATYYVKSFFLAFNLRDLLKGHVIKAQALKLLKLYWLPLYAILPDFIFSFGAVIVTMIAGSTLPVAYLTAASLIGRPVGLTQSLAAGLYPRLLRGPSSRDVEVSFGLTFMFAIPMFIGVLILAQPLLNILRPDYVDITPIVIIVAIHSLSATLPSILSTIVMGVERIDVSERANFKDYIKSRLFLMYTLSYMHGALYLLLLYAILSTIKSFDLMSLAITWSLISLLTYIPFTVYMWKLAKRMLNFAFPVKSLFKYFVASVPMALLTYLLKPKMLSHQLIKALMDLLPCI
ncbi:MAG: hypothetical protein QXR81_08265, partial [Candidatus Nezhaarchaeales archaeon]